jgi:hypothetical protein
VFIIQALSNVVEKETMLEEEEEEEEKEEEKEEDDDDGDDDNDGDKLLANPEGDISGEQALELK